MEFHAEKSFTLPGKLPLGARNNKFFKVPKESFGLIHKATLYIPIYICGISALKGLHYLVNYPWDKIKSIWPSFHKELSTVSKNFLEIFNC